MSRIGKKTVTVPAGVKVSIDSNSRSIEIESSKGKLSLVHHPEVVVEWSEDEKSISCRLADGFEEKNGQAKAYWGLTRSLVNNMVVGVTEGYTKKLEIVGVGYGAKVQGQSIVLKLGFANEITHGIADGLDVSVEREIVTINGIDKQKVGELAAKIKNTRKPEPYNGKGVRYLGEQITRKQGKAFGA